MSRLLKKPICNVLSIQGDLFSKNMFYFFAVYCGITEFSGILQVEKQREMYKKKSMDAAEDVKLEKMKNELRRRHTAGQLPGNLAAAEL